MRVKTGFEAKDVFDFKVMEYPKGKLIRWNNDLLNGSGKYYVENFNKNDNNIPDVLKGLDFAYIPNPFVKDFEGEYSAFAEWNMESSLLAFKYGYCDGFVSTHMFYCGLTTKPFIVLDEKRREEVRNYFATDFKPFLDKIDEDDFKYGIRLSNASDILGINTDERYNTWEKAVKDAEQFVNEKEQEDDETDPDWNKASHEERVKALAEMNYYHRVYKNIFGQKISEPIGFNTEKEATEFADNLTKSFEYSNFYGMEYTLELFNVQFRDWVESTKDDPQ